MCEDFSGIWYAVIVFFFFNDTATTEIYTLSLHDALPISARTPAPAPRPARPRPASRRGRSAPSGRARGSPRRPSPRRRGDRKSTRLNSSHANISYAVFCLKKKKYIARLLLQVLSIKHAHP